MRAHAAACPECGPELAAMEQTVAPLGELVPPAQINRGRGRGNSLSPADARALRARVAIRRRCLVRRTLRAESQVLPDRDQRITPGGQRIVTGEIEASHSCTDAWCAVSTCVPVRRSVNWYAIAATVALVITGAQLFRVTSDRNECGISSLPSTRQARRRQPHAGVESERLDDSGDDWS